MSAFIIAEEDIRNARTTALGSVTFIKNTAINGIATPRLNVAIPIAEEKFLPTYHEADGFQGLSEYYSLLRHYGYEHFFIFEEALVHGLYGVFSFGMDTDEGWQCLADVQEPMGTEQALDIFRHLVQIIKQYSNSKMHVSAYRPMKFICRDSVYFRYDENGELQLRLLPLPCVQPTNYVGMPQALNDVAADVYMAAYLYLSLKYPDGAAFDEDNDVDFLAESCLSLFPQRRPAVHELVAWLDMYADEAEIAHLPPIGDVSAERIRTTRVTDENDTEEEPSYLSAVKEKWQRFYAGLQARKEQAEQTMDQVHDRFDRRFSTEEGDKAEANNDDE